MIHHCVWLCLQEMQIHSVGLFAVGHWPVRVDRGRSARGAASACPFSAKPLAEASGSRERCYLQGLTALKEEHAAAQWAQSELFFRLLLKNTVCPLHQAAYAYFWRVLPLCEEEPNNSMQSWVVLEEPNNSILVLWGTSNLFLDCS